VVALSHLDIKKRSHTTRSTAINSTDRDMGLAAFWATAASGVAGTAITGTGTVGAVGGRADGMAGTADGMADMAAGTEVGEDMAAEAAMAAAKLQDAVGSQSNSMPPLRRSASSLRICSGKMRPSDRGGNASTEKNPTASVSTPDLSPEVAIPPRNTSFQM
jgi:hypothetical protein